jgi:hypothetical protein
MSDGQYQRVRPSFSSLKYTALTYDSDASVSSFAGSFYILFRVFNHGKDTMGFRFYFNRENHRQKGTLEFSSCKWSVTPVSGDSSDI